MKNLLYIGNQLDLTGNTPSTIDTLSPLIRAEGYHVITTSKRLNKLLRLLDMLWHILKFKNRIDYVLIDTYSTQNFYFAYFCSQLCRLLNLKYIPVLRGGHLENRLLNSKRLSQAIFNNALKNVVPSEYLNSVFKKYGYKKLELISNSIKMQNYPFIKKTFDTPKLLWVRSFANIYNPLLAIKVLKGLKEQNIHAELCMVGPDKDGSLQKTKDYANELGVKVTFTGKLSKQEWVELSKEYNAFLNTTNFDNMPVSVIEAMALGLPIISTNVGGVPFLIDNNIDGILVEPDNERLLVDAVIKIFSNQINVNQMVMKARKKVEQFDWVVVKQKWEDLLS